MKRNIPGARTAVNPVSNRQRAMSAAGLLPTAVFVKIVSSGGKIDMGYFVIVAILGAFWLAYDAI